MLSHDLTREGKRLLAVALLGAALTACGGGGDDSATVTAPPNAQAGAAAGNAGGAAAGDAAPAGGPPSSSVGDRSATLSWNPPTTNLDGTPLKLTGYRIYWGPMDDYYPQSVTVDNPGLSRYVVENLAPATWYFVVTALAGDAESPPSNVLKMDIR